MQCLADEVIYLSPSKQMQENVQVKGERERKERQSEGALLQAPFCSLETDCKTVSELSCGERKGSKIFHYVIANVHKIRASISSPLSQGCSPMGS